MFKALGVHSGIVRRGGSDHEFLIIILMLIWIVISMNVISSVQCYRDHEKHSTLLSWSWTIFYIVIMIMNNFLHCYRDHEKHSTLLSWSWKLSILLSWSWKIVFIVIVIMKKLSTLLSWSWKTFYIVIVIMKNFLHCYHDHEKTSENQISSCYMFCGKKAKSTTRNLTDLHFWWHNQLQSAIILLNRNTKEFVHLYWKPTVNLDLLYL